MDRLLYPKVLTNAKRYTSDGVQSIADISKDDNLIIKGNNLLCLSSINNRFNGRIKCIFIDPPYYTGKCPTLRAQRDGVLYVRNGTIYQLTGYEALLLQGFPKEYAEKVKHEVTDRHLLMQAGNAMTVNVIQALGNSITKFIESQGEL